MSIYFRIFNRNKRKYDNPNDEYLTMSFNGDIFSYNEGKWVNDQYIIEQFTGRYDKDGKPIYEGDVLALWDVSDKGLFHVVRDLSAWGYNFTYEHISGYECCTHIMDKIIVIGNVSEHPELLDG